MAMQAGKLRRFGYVALAAALLTISLIAILSYEDGRRYDVAFLEASNIREFLTLNQELLDDLRDAEIGQRGFILTGRTDYLDPYDAAIRKIPDTVHHLESLAQSKPDITRLVGQLRLNIDAKLAELRQTIDLYRTSGAAAALNMVQTDRGKQSMDRVRSLSQQLHNLEEQRRIAARHEIELQSARIRLIVIIGSLLLGLLVAVGTFALSRSTRQYEETLNLLNSTLYGIGDGVITTDRNGCVKLMNNVAERLTGYTEDEARGRDVEAVFRIAHEANRRPMDNAVRSVIREGPAAPIPNHAVLISRSGASAPIDGCATSLKTPNGTLLGAVLVFRDVSDRKQAVESARRLAAIVENSDDAIIGKTLDGVVTTWNHGAERLFGFTAEEMIGHRLTRLIPPDRPDDLTLILDKIALGESVEHYLTERLTKDGRKLFVSLSVSPIRNDEGQVVGASKIARDVTHERQLENSLRQAQKMEAVGRLAGGVAHDFNNLLTVILGYGSTLSNRIPAGDPLAKMVAEICRAAEQASALTGQLLAFSRKQVTEPRVVDVNNALADMKNMLQRLIGEDIDLRFVRDETSCCIRIDPTQLSQVLLNLSVNARDAMPKGGTLTVEVHKVIREHEDAGAYGIRPAGPYVRLSFTDSGIGMDAETRAHIFEPFFTTKESGKGTGLGLATIYGILQQNGGWVDVYSELGHGTTFTLYFPLVDAAAPDVPAQTLPEPVYSRRFANILLVEDQAAIRMLAEDVLMEARHNVVSAPNGRAALQLLEKHTGTIEILITDVVMPEMSGPELAAHLSTSRPDLRILYISGFTDHALLHRGVIEQGTAFLQKPFVPAALLEKVDSLWPHNMGAHA